MFNGFIKFPFSKGQTGLSHQLITIMDQIKQLNVNCIKLFLFAVLQFHILAFCYCCQKFFVSKVDKVGLVMVD